MSLSIQTECQGVLSELLFLIDAEGKKDNRGIRELGVVAVNKSGKIVKSWQMTDSVKIREFLNRSIVCIVWGSFDDVLATRHCRGSYRATLIDVSNGEKLDSVCSQLGVNPSRPRHCAIKDAVTLYKVCKARNMFRRICDEQGKRVRR